LFIKRTKRTLRGKVYTNHLLVESVATERGPRHRVVCSLGSLAPGPKAQWLKLAHHLQQSLSGQESLLDDSPQEQVALQKPEVAVRGPKKHRSGSDIDWDEVEVEEARQARAVHVGHQIWQRPGLDEILAGAGFGRKTRIMTQIMTLRNGPPHRIAKTPNGSHGMKSNPGLFTGSIIGQRQSLPRGVLTQKKVVACPPGTDVR
jgi:hypothetical protein